MEPSSTPDGQPNSKNKIITLDSHQKETIRASLVESAKKLLGVPYEFGAEWTMYAIIPKSLDCSEMVEGIYTLNGLHIPDGSQAQFRFTVPTGTPCPGDLVFFGRGGKPDEVYHVGLVFSETEIIEARGFQPGSSFETGKVILRPRLNWEKYSNWLGYRSHPKLA